MYYELRDAHLETTYLPNPREGKRVTEALHALDPILELVHHSVSDTLVKDMILWVYRLFLQSHEFVLLYGGPDRQFEPRDSDILMDDLLVTYIGTSIY